jgi:hypothetical protein
MVPAICEARDVGDLPAGIALERGEHERALELALRPD